MPEGAESVASWSATTGAVVRGTVGAEGAGAVTLCEEIAPEASICKNGRADLGALAVAAGAATTAEVSVDTAGIETEIARGVSDFDEKTGERPGGLASERLEMEPDKNRALEAKVHRETLRLRRDALDEAKRCVQLAEFPAEENAFFAMRRGLGAGVCTMKSPLDFEGAASISEVTCEKTAPKQQKRPCLESRS